MSLNKSFFDRETNIKVKVICDSISEQGIRITTFEVEAPRIILAEINTHKAISKNCSSTRAITLSKAIEQVQENGFEPLYWGKKKTGMSAEQEISNTFSAKGFWENAKRNAITSVEHLDNIEVHKQITGRLLEPFQMVKQVLTATDWDNFFNLRIHPDAQPEICMLAYKMYKAVEESKPYELKEGEYHLPYVETEHWGEDIKYFVFEVSFDYDQSYGMKCEKYLTLDEAIKISAASCASVSYRTEGMTLEKADKIFDMLIKAEVLHASPFEHLATPIKDEQEIENSDYLTVGFVNKTGDPKTWEKGVTHMNKQGQLCSGNLRGFIQYRHLLPNNTNWSFDFEDRMKMFG